MANKRFLESITSRISTSSSSKDFDSSNKEYKYEDDDISMESLGTSNLIKDESNNVEEKNAEEINNDLDAYLNNFNGNNSSVKEKIKETLEEDFGAIGDSRPIDLSNLPPVNLDDSEENYEEASIDNKNIKVFEEENEAEEITQNIEEKESIEENNVEEVEKDEIKEVKDKEINKKEEPKEEEHIITKRRGRGRPKNYESPQSKKEKDLENKEGEKTMNKNISHDSDVDILAENILNCVCRNTIKFLSNNYISKIYTEEFTKKLFNGFLNGEIDNSNPLLVELIKECSNSDVEDPYLGELTKDVLNFIKGRNV